MGARDEHADSRSTRLNSAGFVSEKGGETIDYRTDTLHLKRCGDYMVGLLGLIVPRASHVQTC